MKVLRSFRSRKLILIIILNGYLYKQPEICYFVSLYLWAAQDPMHGRESDDADLGAHTQRLE